MICTNCGGTATYTTNAAVYGREYGAWPFIWLCPVCGCYVGTHPGTNEPLGTLADAETRRARKLAHAALDPLWRDGQMTRSAAYAWLAQQMDLEADVCHIGLFTKAQCAQVVRLVMARVAA